MLLNFLVLHLCRCTISSSLLSVGTVRLPTYVDSQSMLRALRLQLLDVENQGIVLLV